VPPRAGLPDRHTSQQESETREETSRRKQLGLLGTRPAKLRKSCYLANMLGVKWKRYLF
jgi:hypothetical protein